MYIVSRHVREDERHDFSGIRRLRERAAAGSRNMLPDDIDVLNTGTVRRELEKNSAYNNLGPLYPQARPVPQGAPVGSMARRKSMRGYAHASSDAKVISRC